MKIVAVIPSRYESSRFPGKPLAEICGKPMVWWVYQQVKKIQEIDESACINRLMALEGAIRGVKKTMLPDEVKADLKDFYREHRR